MVTREGGKSYIASLRQEIQEDPQITARRREGGLEIPLEWRKDQDGGERYILMMEKYHQGCLQRNPPCMHTVCIYTTVCMHTTHHCSCKALQAADPLQVFLSYLQMEAMQEIILGRNRLTQQNQLQQLR